MVSGSSNHQHQVNEVLGGKNKPSVSNTTSAGGSVGSPAATTPPPALSNSRLNHLHPHDDDDDAPSQGAAVWASLPCLIPFVFYLLLIIILTHHTIIQCKLFLKMGASFVPSPVIFGKFTQLWNSWSFVHFIFPLCSWSRRMLLFFFSKWMNDLIVWVWFPPKVCAIPSFCGKFIV